MTVTVYHVVICNTVMLDLTGLVMTIYHVVMCNTVMLDYLDWS